MDRTQEAALKRYLIAPLQLLKRIGPIPLYFLLVVTIAFYLNTGDSEGFLHLLTFAVLVVLAFYLIGLLVQLPGVLWKADDTISALRQQRALEEVLTDFAVATELPGLCRIGEHYFIGQGTGIVVDLRQVIRIRRDIVTTRDSENKRHSSIHLSFELPDGRSELLADLSIYFINMSARRDRIHQALTLLDGRFPIDPEALKI